MTEPRLKTYWAYSRLPAWRRWLHRLAHTIGIQRRITIWHARDPLKAIGDRCVTCGEVRRY